MSHPLQVPKIFLKKRRILFAVQERGDYGVEVHFSDVWAIRLWARPFVWWLDFCHREGFTKDGVGL